MDRFKLQRIMLELLGKRDVDRRLGRGQHYFAEAVIAAYDGTPPLTASDVMEMFWSLIAQGLAFIDVSQSAPENWELRLTAAGRAALSDEELNPDEPSRFLGSLMRAIPTITPLVKRYAEEAVRSYNHQLYLASAVMLGVASEAAFLEAARIFADLLQGEGKDKFGKLLEDPKVGYAQKFTEFNKRLDPRRADLPVELRENFDLHVNATLDLIRVYRNESGHPTGRVLSREDCFAILRLGVTYLRRMYALKEHFTASLGGA